MALKIVTAGGENGERREQKPTEVCNNITCIMQTNIL